MAQSSGPFVDEPFTDAQFRHIVGDDSSIRYDFDGTAFKLTLSATSNIATVGSATQDSIAVVAGREHLIPAGQPQEIEIPEATGPGQAWFLCSRHEPEWSSRSAGDDGPVRLAVVAREEAASYPDVSYPGVENLVHYEISRAVNESLSQASVADVRTWSGPTRYLARGDEFPASPIGTVVNLTTNGLQYIRALQRDTGTVDWVRRRGDAFDLASVSETARNAYMKAGTAIVTTNAFGDASIVFPSPFPNALVSAVVSDATATTGLGAVVLKVGAARAADKSAIYLRAYGMSGGQLSSLPNVGVAIMWQAVGY